MSSGSKVDPLEAILQSAKRKRSTASSDVASASKKSAPAASFQTPPTQSSSARPEPLEVDPLSRHPPTPPASPRASASGGTTAHFLEGFGNVDKVSYWPEIDQLFFPPLKEAFSEFSPEEMAENDVHNAFMTLQSSLYNRKMINAVQTTSRATNVKNQELKRTVADLAQQRSDLKERVVELKAELAVAKKKLKEGADQLARTQEVCNTFSDSLKRSDEKIGELISGHQCCCLCHLAGKYQRDAHCS
ncbi:uncharacterized protein LOC141596420 [Silene latifolia]|uniref:uncharacterized protein LOC141596420 n=1 Tax=Silene latifolia TaxID=37657 RepID=UPI003D778CC4